MTTAAPAAPPLVDVHAHFLPPWYVEAARAAGHEVPDGMPGWPTWSVEGHLALMDACGIDRAVLSISSPGVHFGDDAAARDLAVRVNDVAAQVCRAHPGRFDFFAALPLPDVPGALEELARALDTLGAVGVAVECNASGRYLGDPGFEPLWEELGRLWYDLAGTPMPTDAPLLVSVVGAEHVLYGSDHCSTPAGGVAELVAGNAQELFSA